MHVCVFCSASNVDEKYTKPAAEFARLIGEKGHTLVWGGNDKGMMAIIAHSAKNAGARLIGVNAEAFRLMVFKDADEMLMTKSLGERKTAMLEKADVIVMLVGGIGTLDEATDVLELKKHGAHNKPIIILNTDNFYEGLKMQLERIEREGFLKSLDHIPPLNELIYFADTPEDAMRYIEAHGT